jgi:hypothetical protein
LYRFNLVKLDAPTVAAFSISDSRCDTVTTFEESDSHREETIMVGTRIQEKASPGKLGLLVEYRRHYAHNETVLSEMACYAIQVGYDAEKT